MNMKPRDVAKAKVRYGSVADIAMAMELVCLVPAADIEAMRLSSNASVSIVHRSISAVTEETVHLFLHQLIVDQLERL
jgi:hypothetical protein